MQYGAWIARQGKNGSNEIHISLYRRHDFHPGRDLVAGGLRCVAVQIGDGKGRVLPFAEEARAAQADRRDFL